jgi:radical SAM protein with 4Fe4S-binding SPASM domain
MPERNAVRGGYMSLDKTNNDILRLRDKTWLRPCKGYAMLHRDRINEKEIIKPGEAFILALCDGTTTRSEVIYLVSKTFGISNPDAKKTVDTVIDRFFRYVEVLKTPLPRSQNIEPSDFIMASRTDKIGIGTEPLDFPWEVGILISYQCNFRCRYCYLPNPQNTTRRKANSCTFETCQKVIAEACAWGVPFIGLYGGEPFLFPKWDRLAEQVVAGGAVPLITSNGSLIGEREVQRIVEINIRRILISLEATDEQMFSSITGVPGEIFFRVCSAISSLVNHGISVSVKAVCMPENIKVTEVLTERLVDLGVKSIHFTRMERGGPGGPSWNCPAPTEEQLEAVRSVVQKYSEKFNIKITAPRRPYSDVFLCGGLHFSLGILPPGIACVCEKFSSYPEFDLGDVRRETLKEIWFGERANRLRKQCINPLEVHSSCSSCVKLQKCMTGCFFDSYIATGHPFAPPPYCKGPYAGNHEM